LKIVNVVLDFLKSPIDFRSPSPDYLCNTNGRSGAAVRRQAMDFAVLLSRDYFDEFVRSRMRSAGYYRPGGPSVAVRLVGVIAASLERLAAAVRRWAREPGDTRVAPHRSALVRH